MRGRKITFDDENHEARRRASAKFYKKNKERIAAEKKDFYAKKKLATVSDAELDKRAMERPL